MMSILKFVVVCLEVLVLFNLLIFAHELGHFLAARWRGLKIERFAIWFGKPIWKAKINGIEYCLGCIPAGGYVSLPQMASMEAIEGKTEQKAEELPPVSVGNKIIVAFAGPLFSFLLALLFAAVVMVVGRPVSELETTTVIGHVEKDGPADVAGLKTGDKILEVDGQPVVKFGGMGDSVTWRIVRSEGTNVAVKVDRAGQILTFYPVPIKEPTKPWQRKSLRQIKIGPAHSAVVAEVAARGPAARAGLEKGDRVLSVNGMRLYHFIELADYIGEHPGEVLTLKYERQGREIVAALTPETTLSPTNSGAWQLSEGEIRNLQSLAEKLLDRSNALSATLQGPFSESTRRLLRQARDPNTDTSRLETALVKELNQIIQGISLYESSRFGGVRLSERTKKLLARQPHGEELAHLNRLLLEDAFPLEIAANANDRPRLGIVWDPNVYRLVFPGAIEQVTDSINAMVATFGALFSRKSDIKPQHLSGAVKIFSIYYMLFESEQGWRLALWFSVVLNVNLALLNLLPFPVLDGGHIVLSILEAIRRRPVSARVLNALQTTCAVLIIGYMLYITFFDLQELPWGGSKEKEAPAMKFAPQPKPAR